MTSNDQWFSALQVLTIKTNIQNIRKHKTIDESDVSELGTFANFSAYMSESYIRDGLIPDETAFRVNSFVEGFHDALIMYALSIDFVSTILSNAAPLLIKFSGDFAESRLARWSTNFGFDEKSKNGRNRISSFNRRIRKQIWRLFTACNGWKWWTAI